MARTVTITTTKSIGQIAYEASRGTAEWENLPPSERIRWENIAEAVAKAIDADRPGYQQDGVPFTICKDGTASHDVEKGEVVRIDASAIRDLLARTADDDKNWPRSMGPQFDFMTMGKIGAGGEVAK